MYKKLDCISLISAIQTKIKEKTGLNCYDAVPSNAVSPFYFAEIIEKESADTKTMLRDMFTVNIHAIAKPSQSSVNIYELINNLEEALTEEVELPSGYELIMQTENGLQALKTDETNEKHAILSYDFMVCYGLKFK